MLTEGGTRKIVRGRHRWLEQRSLFSLALLFATVVIALLRVPPVLPVILPKSQGLLRQYDLC